MRNEAFNIVGLLKACATHKNLGEGFKLHAYIWEHNLVEKNTYIGSILVHMYAKCGALAKAQQVLEELPIRDVASWSALIAGCTQQGQGEKALKWFDSMQCEGHTPDTVTFICVLSACGNVGALVKGQEIHDQILNLGMLKKDMILGNTLVDMYAKCGALAKARQVLEQLPFRNEITWSALTAGYVEQGKGEEALKCFDRMLHEGHTLDVVTFVCVLKACGIMGDAAKGKEIHEMIVHLGMLEKDIMIGNSLIHMYMKCGALIKAQQVLEALPVRNVVTWNALIAGYVQHNQGKEALNCFDNMQCEGFSPDMVTFICALKACGNIGAAAKVEEIHGRIAGLGMLLKDNVLGNVLVDMYTKCGALTKAQKLLEELPVRNIITWCTLIGGFAQEGQGKEALECFDNMLREGHCPNAVTFICVLKACGSIGADVKGKEVHHKIVSLGMLDKDIVLGNALVGMYAKCGALVKAQQVLKELPVRNAVTWSALMAVYAVHGQGEEALKCFDIMLHEGHFPDAIAFICVLKACGSIGAAAKGEEIHDKIVSLGILEKDIRLGNALVDMYRRCGKLTNAQQMLEELPIQDVVTWSALIAGYAQQGQSLEAISCFESMQLKGVRPDSITLTLILSACSYTGLLDQAEAYFSGMTINFGIHPNLEHYCCLIDLFCRVGKLNRALAVIGEMPLDKCLPNWVGLLGACSKWGEVKIGRLAFEHALHLDKSNAAFYVVMANTYTAAGMKTGAD